MEVSTKARLRGGRCEVRLITPPKASFPYKFEAPPRSTSTRSTANRGTRFQYTQPPKASLSGIPSSSTRARLAPLAPTPRRETPCEVGLATRLFERSEERRVGKERRYGWSRAPKAVKHGHHNLE